MRYQLINIIVLISLLVLSVACGKDNSIDNPKLVPLEQCTIVQGSLVCSN